MSSPGEGTTGREGSTAKTAGEGGNYEGGALQRISSGLGLKRACMESTVLSKCVGNTAAPQCCRKILTA